MQRIIALLALLLSLSAIAAPQLSNEFDRSSTINSSSSDGGTKGNGVP